MDQKTIEKYLKGTISTREREDVMAWIVGPCLVLCYSRREE